MILVVFVAVMYVYKSVTAPEEVANWRIGDLSVIVMLIVLYLFPVVLVMPLPFKGLWLISEQEKFFHFSFREEMRDCRLRGIDYTDSRWFVYVTMTRIIALRRDYIDLAMMTQKKELSMHKNDWRRRTYYMMLNTVDGRTIKLVGDQHPLRLLILWLTKEPGRITEEEEEAAWKEYE